MARLQPQGQPAQRLAVNANRDMMRVQDELQAVATNRLLGQPADHRTEVQAIHGGQGMPLPPYVGRQGGRDR